MHSICAIVTSQFLRKSRKIFFIVFQGTILSTRCLLDRLQQYKLFSPVRKLLVFLLKSNPVILHIIKHQCYERQTLNVYFGIFCVI